MRKYPIKYTDRFGTEETEIYSDGSMMYVTLRGIQFEGSDFEALEGHIDTKKFDYAIYQNGSGELSNYRLQVHFPIKMIHNRRITNETLQFEIEVGKNLEIKGLDPIVNAIELNTSFGNFKSTKEIDFFEDAIIDIQNKLPFQTKIISCLSCKYSNYHPVGNGMFGSLYCFKKLKTEVASFKNKHDLINLWTKEAIDKEDIFNVQEIFDCPEHQFITKEDWTYKDWDYKTKRVDD